MKIDFAQERVKPFQLFPGLYYVGAQTGPAHLLDTGDGLLLIDTSLPRTFPLVLESIWEAGYDPRNIRWIVHTHGHVDHIGGTSLLVALTGARTYLGAADLDYVTGKVDLTWAKELDEQYDSPFTPDVLLHDGDVHQFGNITMRFLSTPGHTPGTMSLFFEMQDGDQRVLAGMHGGVGINSMSKKFLESYGLSLDCRQKFFDGLERLKKEPVQLFLGNHLHNNRALEKAQAMADGATSNLFIDPQGWQNFLEQCRKNLESLMAQE